MRQRTAQHYIGYIDISLW